MPSLMFVHSHPLNFCFHPGNLTSLTFMHLTLLSCQHYSKFITQKRDLFSLSGSKKLKFSLFSTIPQDISLCSSIVCFQRSMKSMRGCYLSYYVAREANHGWRFLKYSSNTQIFKMFPQYVSRTFILLYYLNILSINLIETQVSVQTLKNIQFKFLYIHFQRIIEK